MNFDFTETQYALRDLARDIFRKESPPSRVRAVLDGKPLDDGVWNTMAAAGICGITVPEEFGGSGGNELDLTLVYEEAGRVALPERLLEIVGIAAPVITRFGSEEQKERWLPAIASGDAAPQVDIRADAVRIDDDVISGEKVMQAAYARAFVGTAALLNGVSMRLLDMTVSYAKERQQFGRAIGSFQAVKHKLASMHVEIESSRPATWYAAYAVANATADATIAACVAKIAANDCDELCNTEALQCHGGIGFTWEHDLHLWLKRGMQLRNSYGTSHELRSNLYRFHQLEELV